MSNQADTINIWGQYDSDDGFRYPNYNTFQKQNDCYIQQKGQKGKTCASNAQNDIENISQYIQQDQFLVNPPQKQIKAPGPSLPSRTKNYIEIGKKNKKSYIEAKKGTNQQTNDLTINVCTLFKAILNEYKFGQRMYQEQRRIIQKLNQGNQRLESLKRLFGASEQQKQQNNIQMDQQEKNANQNMKKYFIEKLQSAEILQQILKKTKMKFNSKIILFKYFQQIKKLVERPKEFKKWKNSKD